MGLCQPPVEWMHNLHDLCLDPGHTPLTDFFPSCNANSSMLQKGHTHYSYPHSLAGSRSIVFILLHLFLYPFPLFFLSVVQLLESPQTHMLKFDLQDKSTRRCHLEEMISN